VELRRDRVKEDSEVWGYRVQTEIVVKDDLIDMSRRKAGIGFRGDNSRMMQSADCRRDLRVEVEAVDLGTHHSLLWGCNSQTEYRTAKSGVAHRTPDRRRDYRADGRQHYVIWSDYCTPVNCIQVAPSAGGI
jgi:hypothetical protein